MNYSIRFSVRCNRGKVRAKNQDNFWCGGIFLESENDGITAPIDNTVKSEDKPFFAVFDGMGGENYGEIAAYLAAKTFNGYYSENPVSEIKMFLSETCFKMNAEICAYMKQKRTGNMGTTCAILAFGSDGVYICNIGDSKIFRFNKGTLSQVSYDHIIEVAVGRKPKLSQCLGIPEDDFIIEPYITKAEYADGDVYLICSDGLTDMISNAEIERIISVKESVSKRAETLLNSALINGGTDNITVILCEIYSDV